MNRGVNEIPGRCLNPLWDNNKANLFSLPGFCLAVGRACVCNTRLNGRIVGCREMLSTNSNLLRAKPIPVRRGAAIGLLLGLSRQGLTA
jgi:hypothetical protein